MMTLPYVIQALLYGLILYFLLIKTKNMSMKKKIIIICIFGFLYGYVSSILIEMLLV